MGAIEDEVEGAARAVGHIADATLVVEDNLIGDNFPVLDDEAMELFCFEASGKEVVFPFGESVAFVEVDSADGDGGGPVVDG